MALLDRKKGTKMTEFEISAVEIFDAVARAEFRPFSKADYSAFAGVDGDNALIGEFDGLILAVDGETVFYVSENGHFYGSYKLGRG